MNAKERVGFAAAQYVQTDMIVGLGTGSTSTFFIQALAARRAQEDLVFSAVSSSFSSTILAQQFGIPLLSLDQISEIDLYADGADEVDSGKNLLKGRGGAMVREKLLAYAAQQFLVIVDSGKIVSRLGTAFPLPVEALTMAWRIVQKGLQDLGGICTLREAAGKDGPVVTDQGNFILDTVFPATVNWVDLDTPIMRIPGVVGHGLFTAFTDKSTILVGDDKGVSVL